MLVNEQSNERHFRPCKLRSPVHGTSERSSVHTSGLVHTSGSVHTCDFVSLIFQQEIAYSLQYCNPFYPSTRTPLVLHRFGVLHAAGATLSSEIPDVQCIQFCYNCHYSKTFCMITNIDRVVIVTQRHANNSFETQPHAVNSFQPIFCHTICELRPQRMARR